MRKIDGPRQKAYSLGVRISRIKYCDYARLGVDVTLVG